MLETPTEENFFHALREFVYNQIERIHTVKKVKNVILEPYKELLEWLCLANQTMEPQQFGEVILDFCKVVNKAVKELICPPL